MTAWELAQHGVPHTLVADNAGGHLMQRGLVDLCIVGTDRTTRAGDVCNKIGTYLKALAARESRVPFYVAAPSPSIDWTIGAAPSRSRTRGAVRRFTPRAGRRHAEVSSCPRTALANPASMSRPPPRDRPHRARRVRRLAGGLRALFPETAQ